MSTAARRAWRTGPAVIALSPVDHSDGNSPAQQGKIFASSSNVAAPGAKIHV
jgi:hypothetical protein